MLLVYSPGRAPACAGQQRPFPSGHQGRQSADEHALDEHPPGEHLVWPHPLDPQMEGWAVAWNMCESHRKLTGSLSPLHIPQPMLWNRSLVFLL